MKQKGTERHMGSRYPMKKNSSLKALSIIKKGIFNAKKLQSTMKL